MRQPVTRAAGLAIIAVLAVAPAALAVRPGHYVGKTSQKLRVDLRVTSATRGDISVHHRGRCTNGMHFTATASIVDMKIDRDGSFSSRQEGKGRFEGVGRGTFRYRLEGEVRKNVSEGTFRATFTSGSVTCRSGGVRLTARRR